MFKLVKKDEKSIPNEHKLFCKKIHTYALGILFSSFLTSLNISRIFYGRFYGIRTLKSIKYSLGSWNEQFDVRELFGFL